MNVWHVSEYPEFIIGRHYSSHEKDLLHLRDLLRFLMQFDIMYDFYFSNGEIGIWMKEEEYGHF